MPPTTNNNSNPAAEQPFFLDGQYHGLGRTALYLHILKKGSISICFLVIDIALLALASSGTLNPLVKTNPQLIPVINDVILIFFAGFIIALFIGIIAGYFAYTSFKYRITENGFSVERGIASKQETSLPFHQIQNVDVEQSALYRLFGLCDLVILTAGHEDKMDKSKNESEIVLAGIETDTAHQLQTYLIERSNIQETAPAPVIPANVA